MTALVARISNIHMMMVCGDDGLYVIMNALLGYFLVFFLLYFIFGPFWLLSFTFLPRNWLSFLDRVLAVVLL